MVYSGWSTKHTIVKMIFRVIHLLIHSSEGTVMVVIRVANRPHQSLRRW
jgi:hypothetical protein